MIAKELRIGNWLKDTEVGYKDNFKVSAGDIVDMCNSTETFEPIVITNTFLVLNKFSEDNNGHFWLNLQTHYLELIPMSDGYYPVYVQLPEMSSEAEQKVGMNKINYVHQLQNLHYCLTGIELEVVW